MKRETALRFYRKLEESELLQNYIAQANSRYILYVAGEPIKKFPNYTKNLDLRCTHIAFSYLSCGWQFFNDKDTEYATKSLEKAGEILEYLYAIKGIRKPYIEYYRLIGSLAYYIASQYSKSFIILKNYESQTFLSELTKLFLTRKFKEMETVLKRRFLGRLKTDTSIKAEQDDNDVYEEITSKVFLHMMQYIQTGKGKHLEKSKSILRDLISLSNINNEPHMWWYFRLLYLVFKEYEEASLWRIIPPLLDNDKISSKYIYANLYRESPITELFKSQRESISKELLNEKGFVIGMPTSSGKTKVAEITILETLSEHPESLCIYMAPYRSLANEIERNLSEIFEVIGYKVSQLYGGFQSSFIDNYSIENSNIIIATPEKVKSLLRSNENLKKRIQLVIVDEGHLVGVNKRYITSELLIEELKIVVRRNQGQLVLLSAVLPNISDFSLWIGEDIDAKRKTSWRPSSQRFGVLTFKGNAVDIEWEGEIPSFNNNFITPSLVKKKRTTKTGKVYPAKYFPSDKKDAIAATSVKLLDVGSILIYVGKTNIVLSQARSILKVFKERKIKHEWKNEIDWLFVKLACEEAYGDNSEVLSLLERGIVPHSAQLPFEVRQSIEKLMADDNPKVIIATSTLGQGVNIGISTVIISNVYLNQNSLVKVNDFWNLIGRAGRAFTDTEGKILYAVDQNKSAWSVRKQLELKKMYFEQANIDKATSGIYQLLKHLYKLAQQFGIEYNLFLELLAENRSFNEEESIERFFSKADRLLDLIDDTLISMNITYDAHLLENPSSWIDDVFRFSLAYIQSKRDESFAEEKVIEVLKARNKGVIRIVGNKDKWNSIASSSVPVRASIKIENKLEEVLTYINEYADSNQLLKDFLLFVKKLDEYILDLPISIDDKAVTPTNLLKVREGWFEGFSIKKIEQSCKDARKICNKYYSFHFPWIVNAIAKKLKLIDKNYEAEILEQTSLLAELGLNNIESAKIYLSGVESRICANELSNKVEINNNDSSLSIKESLFRFLKQCEIGEKNCSELCIKWLELLNMKNQEMKKTFRVKRRQFKTKRYIEYNRLYVKAFQGEVLLCSFDYKVKIPILKSKELFIPYSNRTDLFLRKRSQNSWIIDTNNPYIELY